MPTIFVELQKDIFSPVEKQKLATAISDAAAAAERIPESPSYRRSVIIYLREVDNVDIYSAGTAGAYRNAIFVTMRIYLPLGVLDQQARKAMIVGIDQAVKYVATHKGETPATTSCIIHELPDGFWGVNGKVFTLADFTAIAGYEHLQAVV